MEETLAIRFVGEQFAGKKIKDVCPFDPRKKYIFNISPCGVMQFEDVDVFFSQIQGYDPNTQQVLTHDTNGKLIWKQY